MPATSTNSFGHGCRGMLLLAVVAWFAGGSGEELRAQDNVDYYGYEYGSSLPMPNESPVDFFSRTYDALSWSSVSPETYQGEIATQGSYSAIDAPAAESEGSSSQFASFSDSQELTESYTEDYSQLSHGGNCGPQCGPSNRKPGVFQKLVLTGTYLPQSDNADLGVTDLEAYAVFGLPCPTVDTPLLITPGFAAHAWNGPNAPDLPGTVYDAYVQFRWLGKINDCWGFDVAVSPGIYTDFEDVSGDAFRITGRAFASYQKSPTSMWVMGVVYLDREDVPFLPGAGLIYTPTDDVRWELIMPRPRYARRYYADCCREDWWYVAGEFGGGQWSIQRANGTADVATLRDYRLLAGIERKLDGGAGWRAEVGYVFGRELEFTSATPDVDFDSNFFARLGWTY